MKRILVGLSFLLFFVFLAPLGARALEVVYPAGTQVDLWHYWEEVDDHIFLNADLVGESIVYPDGVIEALDGVKAESCRENNPCKGKRNTLIYLDMTVEVEGKCVWIAWNKYDPDKQVFVMLDDVACVAGEFHPNAGTYNVTWDNFVETGMFDFFCLDHPARPECNE